MFRYEENGKETYRYKPKKGVTNLRDLKITFLGDEKELTIDEQYVLAQQKKKDLIEGIEDILKWSDTLEGIQDKICCINRGCEAYEFTTKLMQEMREQRIVMKMLFYSELINIWKSMLLAYDLIDVSEIGVKKDILDDEKSVYDEDGEWITELSENMRSHWKEKYNIVDEMDKEFRKEKESQRALKATESPKSVEKLIKDAEDQHKRFLREVENKKK